MGERTNRGLENGRLPLQAVKRVGGAHGAPRYSAASLWMRSVTQRLISCPDAANWRGLREETRLVLSALTDYERDVLRVRFGIGEVRRSSLQEVARYDAVANSHVLETEAQALRKLRHPSGRQLQSVSRR